MSVVSQIITKLGECVDQCLSLLFLFRFRVHAGILGQVTNFTIVGGTANHCVHVDQYMVLFRYCLLTVPCRVGYTLGFATHISSIMNSD